jgi:hypothetical protein
MLSGLSSYHLSHFAAEYQELFGELPSQTRRSDAMSAHTGRTLRADPAYRALTP